MYLYSYRQYQPNAGHHSPVHSRLFTASPLLASTCCTLSSYESSLTSSPARRGPIVLRQGSAFIKGTGTTHQVVNAYSIQNRRFGYSWKLPVGSAAASHVSTQPQITAMLTFPSALPELPGRNAQRDQRFGNTSQ
eukprot:2176485-Pleurochrysis_carterae.AAC.2